MSHPFYTPPNADDLAGALRGLDDQTLEQALRYYRGWVGFLEGELAQRARRAKVKRDVQQRLRTRPKTPAELRQLERDGRDRQILRLAGRGLSDREIARQVGVSARTVQRAVARAHRDGTKESPAGCLPGGA